MFDAAPGGTPTTLEPARGCHSSPGADRATPAGFAVESLQLDVGHADRRWDSSLRPGDAKPLVRLALAPAADDEVILERAGSTRPGRLLWAMTMPLLRLRETLPPCRIQRPPASGCRANQARVRVGVPWRGSRRGARGRALPAGPPRGGLRAWVFQKVLHPCSSWSKCKRYLQRQGCFCSAFLEPSPRPLEQAVMQGKVPWDP